MTAAQKKARAVFMKAIQYRKSHPGVTLKQAFAYAKTGKATVAGSVKPKKKAPTKIKAAIKRKTVSRSAHKDTKSHNVNIRVVSGVKKQPTTNWPISAWVSVLSLAQANLYMAKNTKDKQYYRKKIQTVKKIITQLKRLK